MAQYSLIIVVVPTVMIIAGVTMLWVASRATIDSRAGDSVGSVVLKVSGCVLAILGMLVHITVMTHAFFIFAWIAVAAVIVTAIYRYYDGERQSLLWILMTAAERGVPLDTAARAFAEEHHGRLGTQTHKLADYLEAGLPLSLALERSGFQGFSPALLAADMGQRTGTLGHALRQAVEQEDKVGAMLRSVAHWLFYLAFLAFFAMAMLTFLMIKVFPVLFHIFREFETAMPPVTQSLHDVANTIVGRWIFILPLLLVAVALLIFGWLNHIGYSLRRFPLARRFWWRADCALVLQWLATGVRQQRPMLEMVRLLAAYFPQPRMRTRLEQAAVRMDRGADWCDSLHRANVIRRAENVVFKAAERTGNLPWALDEMAASSLRRAGWRLRAWLDVAFPMVLLAFGVAILYILLGVMEPLITLIQSLA